MPSIHMVHDENKDREYELELSWVSAETGMKHQMVPKDLYEEAKAYAQSSTQDEMED